MITRYTPDNITRTMLGTNDIFVFGSNTKGIHGSGAAKFAKMYYGAKQGVGEGLSGNSYAFPTLYADSHGGLVLTKRAWVDLFNSACMFYDCADDHPELTFWLTKVGCGLAQYAEPLMILLFNSMKTPKNIIKPEGW